MNFPSRITPGADGNLWFANNGSNSIGSIGTGVTLVSAVPGSPTSVSAIAGVNQATVSWSPPPSNGGLPVASYTVTGSPGGQTCSWSSGPLSCTVTGLTYGFSYTFTVVAHNAIGDGPPWSASVAVGSLLPPVVMTAVGSADTQGVVGSVLGRYDGTPLGANTLGTYNVPAAPSATYVVPANGSRCPSVGWTATGGGGLTSPIQNAPPDSTTAKAYLVAQHSADAGHRECAQVFRSTLDPGSVSANPATEAASAEYYAYGLDAVSVATSSFKATASLTVAQVQAIYGCTITDWASVGGTSGPVTSGTSPRSPSDTRSWFLAAYGINAAALATTNAWCPPVKDQAVVNPGNPGGPKIPFAQNQGASVESADFDRAILPHAGSAWTCQATNSINVTLDLRHDVRLIGQTTGAATPIRAAVIEWNPSNRAYQLNTTTGAKVINETNVVQANPSFSPRHRLRWRPLHRQHPRQHLARLFDRRSLVGFTNAAFGSAGDLCSNDQDGDEQGYAFFAILSAAYASLRSTVNPNGSNLAGATCRFFTPRP